MPITTQEVFYHDIIPKFRCQVNETKILKFYYNSKHGEHSDVTCPMAAKLSAVPNMTAR